MRPAYFIAVLMTMIAGMIAWALHFTLAYGWATLACTPHAYVRFFSFQAGVQCASVLVVAGLAVLSVKALQRKSAQDYSPDLRGFLIAATIGMATLAVIAVLWATLPLLTIPDCRA